MLRHQTRTEQARFLVGHHPDCLRAVIHIYKVDHVKTIQDPSVQRHKPESKANPMKDNTSSQALRDVLPSSSSLSSTMRNESSKSTEKRDKVNQVDEELDSDSSDSTYTHHKKYTKTLEEFIPDKNIGLKLQNSSHEIDWDHLVNFGRALDGVRIYTSTKPTLGARLASSLLSGSP